MTIVNLPHLTNTYEDLTNRVLTEKKEHRLPQSPVPIPRVPPIVAHALSVMPLASLSLSLTAYSRKIAKRHPGLFRTLGDYDHTRFILDPTDLPFIMCLEPNVVLHRILSVPENGVCSPADHVEYHDENGVLDARFGGHTIHRVNQDEAAQPMLESMLVNLSGRQAMTSGAYEKTWR